MDMFVVVAVLAVVALIVFVIAKTAVVVPQQSAYVVETLGRYSRTLSAGFHILVPFVDRVAYRHTLKEQPIDVPEQVCITRDNVQVAIDGVLYMQVLDPRQASYGVNNYMFAISQIAQTTLRSEIGKIDLDRTFEERTAINHSLVQELDKASAAWGVKVLRYEIKKIMPSHETLEAMEKQMRAEREKRAVILTSEGQRDAQINEAEGQKQRVIKESEATRQSQINEAEGEALAILSVANATAEGQAQAILAVANATAEGLRQIAEALRQPGGENAMRLRVAEQYVTQLGHLAKEGNTFVIPANLSDVASMLTLATTLVKGIGGAPPAAS